MFDAQSNFIDLTANSPLGNTGLPFPDPLSSSLTNLTSSLSSASVSYIVNTTSDVSNSTDDLLTLREAIETANLNPGADIIGFDLDNGSTIMLAGTELSITDDLTVNGLGANNLTISGDNASRIFNISGSGTEVALNGLTLANGNTGIEEIETPTGIIDGGGGAILVGIASALVVNNSTLSNNQTVEDGGAILNLGTLMLNSSTLSNNSAGFYGGAISSYGVAATINNSTISNNTAGNDGGGIRSRNGTLTVNNSTVFGNISQTNGGGIRSTLGGTLVVTNSTISGNSNRSGGGGIDVSGSASSTTIRNSIVAGNRVTGDFPAADREIESDPLITSGGYNLFGFSGDSGLDPNVTTLSTDIIPAVALNQILDTALRDNGGPTQTLALVAGSPAINAGDPNYSGSLTTDQRGDGFDRIVNDRIDIGAFEVQRPPAEDVGTLGKSAVTRKGSVNSGDPLDRYQFTLASGTNSFRLTLGDLSANADVFILDSNGNVVTSSSNTGTRAEVINNLPLAAGTYYIEVRQVSGNTNYNLSFRR